MARTWWRGAFRFGFFASDAHSGRGSEKSKNQRQSKSSLQLKKSALLVAFAGASFSAVPPLVAEGGLAAKIFSLGGGAGTIKERESRPTLKIEPSVETLFAEGLLSSEAKFVFRLGPFVPNPAPYLQVNFAQKRALLTISAQFFEF